MSALQPTSEVNLVKADIGFGRPAIRVNRKSFGHAITSGVGKFRHSRIIESPNLDGGKIG